MRAWVWVGVVVWLLTTAAACASWVHQQELERQNCRRWEKRWRHVTMPLCCSGWRDVCVEP